MTLRVLALTLFGWYFIVTGERTVEIGPFATQAACEAAETNARRALPAAWITRVVACYYR